MKKVYFCFLNALDAYHTVNEQIREKLYEEFSGYEVYDLYTMQASLEKIKMVLPETLVIVDLPGISGSMVLIRQLFKMDVPLPDIMVVCDDEETIKSVHALGIEAVRKAKDVLGIYQHELEIF